MVYSPPPINTQVGPNAPWPLGATPQTSPSRQSPSGYEPSPPVISVPLSHAKNPGSSSPSNRHPLNRPLSPDLPTRDALYLFSNFSSYMQSPNEGAEGVGSNEDFGDTLRLLDYARVSPTLATDPRDERSIAVSSQSTLCQCPCPPPQVSVRRRAAALSIAVYDWGSSLAAEPSRLSRPPKQSGSAAIFNTARSSGQGGLQSVKHPDACHATLIVSS